SRTWCSASSIGLLALVVWRVSGRAFQLGFLLALFRLVCRTRPDVALGVVVLNVRLVFACGFLCHGAPAFLFSIFRSCDRRRRSVVSPLAFTRGFDLRAYAAKHCNRISWIDDHSHDFVGDLIT